MPFTADDLNLLLAGILRATADTIGSERLARPLQIALIEQALEQRVGVLCYEKIAGTAAADSFDPDLLARLQAHTVAETVLDAHRQNGLREVLTALGEAGINVLVFKGSALALSHYSHSHLRPRDDSDLLVEARHLPAISRVLLRLGFRRAPGNQQSLVMRQCLYRRRDRNGCLHNLDIHWALTNRPGLGEMFSLAYLRARAVNLPALGDHALAPNPVDAVLIACLHLAAHHVGEIRLIWLYDLQLLVQAMPCGQRQQLAVAIDRLNLSGACRLGLGLSAYYFAAPGSGLDDLLPAPVRPDSIQHPRRLQLWLADLSALPNPTARIHYLYQHLIPSSDFMLGQAGKVSPLWLPWLYLQRAARGLKHLLRH